MADRDPRSPGEPIPLSSSPAISEAAERAREKLHEEIERVRAGVEEMMSEQGRSAMTRSCAASRGAARGDPRLRQAAGAQEREAAREVDRPHRSADAESWRSASIPPSRTAATRNGASTRTPRRCSTASCARSARSPTSSPGPASQPSARKLMLSKPVAMASGGASTAPSSPASTPAPTTTLGPVLSPAQVVPPAQTCGTTTAVPAAGR